MKILILSWRGPHHPRAGGAEVVTHEYAKFWVSNGHNVTLFTSSSGDGKKEEVIDGVKIIRRGEDLKYTVIWEAFKWYLFENSEKFDLVFDHFHGWPFFTPFYVRSKKIAFIHEVARDVWKFNPHKYPLNKLVEFLGYFFEPLVIFLVYFFVPFITVSDSTKKSLVNWGVASKNIIVINNGIKILLIKKTLEKEKRKTLIFLGALTQDKGIEDALETYQLLKLKDKSWKFWIVGKGEDSYVRDLKRRHSDLKDLKFWGFVDEKLKFSLLSRAHILINPSRLEGWGLVVIEAAAMGTPTVGYRVSGLVDSVKHNVTGILVDRNPERLTEAISRLIEDKVRYEHMRLECIKWSKNFGWERSFKKSLRYIGGKLG